MPERHSATEGVADPLHAGVDQPLGRRIPSQAFRSAEELYEAATEVLRHWKSHDGGQRLQQIVPRELRGRANDLLHEARRAGLRIWVEQALATKVPIDTPVDLIWWCRLQYQVLDTFHDAYPAALSYFGGYLSDEEMVRLVQPLLDDMGSVDLMEWLEVLAEFSVHGPEAPSSWEYLNTRGCKYLVNQGSKYVREVAIKLGCSSFPDHPGGLFISEREARRALDRIVGWCNEQENLQPTTSPLTPTPPTAGPAGRARHSPDFRSVHWYGVDYAFTANQATVVRVLWGAWENQTLDVGQEWLLEQADSESKRLADVFKDRGRKHPAWGEMIVPGVTKGAYRLHDPHL